jgi:hypothetical protein
MKCLLPFLVVVPIILLASCAHFTRENAGGASTTSGDLEVKIVSEAESEKHLTAKSHLTQKEIDSSVRRARKLSPGMTVRQVERVVGSLSIGARGRSLQELLDLLPKLPGIRVTATDGVCRFDFVKAPAGNFVFTSWAVLPSEND